MVRSSMLVSASALVATATLVLGIPLPGPAASPREKNQVLQPAESYKDASALLSDIHAPVPTTVILQLDSENESTRKRALEHLQSRTDNSKKRDTSSSDKTKRLLNILLPRFSSSSSSSSTTYSTYTDSTTYKKMPTTYGPLAVIRSLDFETLIIWTSYRPLWAWSIIASMLLLLFIFSLALFEVAGCMLRTWRSSRRNDPTTRHTDAHATPSRLSRKSKAPGGPGEKKTSAH